jgi:hypothetical protein
MWLIQQGNPGRVIKWLGKTTIRHAMFDFQQKKRRRASEHRCRSARNREYEPIISCFNFGGAISVQLPSDSNAMEMPGLPSHEGGGLGCASITNAR